MSDIVLGNIGSGFNRSKINSNFDKIEDVINNGVLHLVGGNNVLQQNIDMDSNRILNLPEALNNTEPVTLKQLNDSLAGIEGAEALLPLVQPRQIGDGVTTTFVTPVSGQAGKSTNGFFVYLDGVYQRPNIDYTVDSGNGNLTFVEASTPVAPNSGVNIDITYFIPKVIDPVTADENSLVTATGTTTARTLGDRFADVVNVKDEGSVGNGVIDDRAAFDAANTKDQLSFIPKPDVSYAFSSPTQMDKSPVLIDPSSKWEDVFDGGDLGLRRGFLADWVAGANIWRFSDRVFVGEASDKFAGTSLPDLGTSWLSSATEGPAYVLANAQMLSMTRSGDPSYAIVGAGIVDVGDTRACASFGGVAINKGSASARCGIFEVQHETTTNTSWGLEVQVKNSSGGGQLISPYGAVPNMTFGMQITAGGDDAFGPISTNPATAGVIITASNSAGSPGWYTGIQFRDGSIVGSEPEAIAFSQGQCIKWYESDTRTPAALIRSNINTAGKTLKLSFENDQLSLVNEGGSTVFNIAATATDINRVQINSSATGIPPSIRMAGADANIDFRLLPKGSGLVRFGAHSAIGAETVTGYIEIKDDTGVVRKLAVLS